MSFDATNANIFFSFIIFYYYSYAGSGDDNFYRHNVNYFSQAREWEVLTTIACLGGIHIGHLNAGLQILQPFLIKAAPPFPRGGGLFALGLIYANYCYNEAVLNVIMNSIDSAQSASTFPIRFSGCFSLGLITFGSQKIEYYDKVFQLLLKDESSDVCEAASYAIGLIMFGCGECDKLKELFEYINENEQKLNKGISMAFAFMMYGKRNE